MTGDARVRGVAIGASLGGLEALRLILSGLRHDLPVPVVVVQHIGPSISQLDKSLAHSSSMPVV